MISKCMMNNTQIEPSDNYAPYDMKMDMNMSGIT